ncbi:MAG: hypothetical protein KDA45_07490 [Planctomycetales bacterium]|nr:hypothetical protein [Planctomycetales bacterium]
MEERDELFHKFKRGIERSPVLSALGVEVLVKRGRFYVERVHQTKDAIKFAEALGRISPLADSVNSLLLEVEYGKSRWSAIAKGSAQKLINTLANDMVGRFHGLGSLNKSLRKAGCGLQRQPVKLCGDLTFVYSESGEVCTPQEALFHYFAVPIAVIAEPRIWYSYHRTPRIVESSADRQRVLVRFLTSSLEGAFYGTCLYICQEGDWGAYAIKPSASDNLLSAEKWLQKRKWEAWV